MAQCITLFQTEDSSPGSPLSFVQTGKGFPVFKTLPSDIQPTDSEDDLRWYLEKHAEKEPFERNRANKATAYVQSLSARLKEIVLGEVHRAEIIRIVVRSNGKAGSKFHEIHWELLELQKQGDPRVVVSRVIQTTNSQLSEDIHSDESGPRMCLMAAREVAVDAEDSTEYEHRLVSQPLVDGIGNSPMNIHIVRPGTFEALRQHLVSSKDRGQPVNMVHFDVHGVIRKHDGKIV
jgi:hypothetical protein